MQKSILITGCSTGIGYDAAHTMQKRGWQVFATCRSQEDCDRLTGEGLTSFVLDYEDEATITSALETCLAATGGTLDAVFNNGAYAIPGPVEDLSRDALRAIFEANFFGYFDLINQIMPTMRQQGYGRIVNCSSLLGMTALRYRGAYNATKFALEGMTDTLRLELRYTLRKHPAGQTEKGRHGQRPRGTRTRSRDRRSHQSGRKPVAQTPLLRDMANPPNQHATSFAAHAPFRYHICTLLRGVQRIFWPFASKRLCQGKRKAVSHGRALLYCNYRNPCGYGCPDDRPWCLYHRGRV